MKRKAEQKTAAEKKPRVSHDKGPQAAPTSKKAPPLLRPKPPPPEKPKAKSKKGRPPKPAPSTAPPAAAAAAPPSHKAKAMKTPAASIKQTLSANSTVAVMDMLDAGGDVAGRCGSRRVEDEATALFLNFAAKRAEKAARAKELQAQRESNLRVKLAEYEEKIKCNQAIMDEARKAAFAEGMTHAIKEVIPDLVREALALPSTSFEEGEVPPSSVGDQGGDDMPMLPDISPAPGMVSGSGTASQHRGRRPTRPLRGQSSGTASASCPPASLGQSATRRSTLAAGST